MKRPTSFSQNNLFFNYPRWWYYQYILKIPVISDMCYAHAGSVIHKVLEEHYENVNICDDNKDEHMEELRELFNTLWDKYKLPQSKIAHKKTEYWLMIINGINHKLEITSTELKIFYTDAVGYIDVINTEKGEIGDWKSSTRSEENEAEYKRQLLFYSYLYYRKFDKIPSKAVVYYLKYPHEKGKLEINPTMEDIKRIENWHLYIRIQMEEVINEGKLPAKCNECGFFCPYKNICIESKEKISFNIDIRGNYLQVTTPLPEIIHTALNKKFSYELKNAHWIIKHYPGANTTVRFWNSKKNFLPIGFMQELIKTLSDYAEFKKKELDISFNDIRKFDDTTVEMPDKFLNGIIPREYQNDAVDAFLKSKIGIIEAGTGSGKTEMAIEAIRRLGYKTLFVVDKIELLRQTKRRLEESLGIKIGQIGAGKKNIQDVTVATIQTLSKNITDYIDYLESVRFAIFDETHKVSAKSYFKLGNYLYNTEYRLGISATAFRDDGDDMKITATVGYKIYDLSSKKLIEKGWLMKPKVTFISNYMSNDQVESLNRQAKGDLINETPNYNNYYTYFIQNNVSRNLVIHDLITKHKGKKILILTKRVDHGKFLKSMIEGSEHLYGGTNKTEREEIFNNFANGELTVLVSTLSIFAEGIDLPQLDVVINGGANKGDVKTIQVLGRVLRKLQGKENAIYYDFIDEHNFFRLASLARKRALIREGHDVEIIKQNQ